MNKQLQTIVGASIEQLYAQHQSKTLNRYIRTTNTKMKELIVLALDFRGLQMNIEEQETKDRRSKQKRIDMIAGIQDKIMDTILEILDEDIREEYYNIISSSYEEND